MLLLGLAARVQWNNDRIRETHEISIIHLPLSFSLVRMHAVGSVRQIFPRKLLNKKATKIDRLQMFHRQQHLSISLSHTLNNRTINSFFLFYCRRHSICSLFLILFHYCVRKLFSPEHPCRESTRVFPFIKHTHVLTRENSWRHGLMTTTTMMVILMSCACVSIWNWWILNQEQSLKSVECFFIVQMQWSNFLIWWQPCLTLK
jgi:hypothetical protein